MDRLKNEAEHLRFGVRGGWLGVEQAVEWADNQIAQSPAPHLALVDVALARTRSREDVVALLDAVPGTADMTAVMRWCLADLLEVVQRQPDVARDVARWVEAAAYEGFLPSSEFASEPTTLEDALGLAEEDAYGTVLSNNIVLMLREAIQHGFRRRRIGRKAAHDLDAASETRRNVFKHPSWRAGIAGNFTDRRPVVSFSQKSRIRSGDHVKSTIRSSSSSDIVLPGALSRLGTDRTGAHLV